MREKNRLVPNYRQNPVEVNLGEEMTNGHEYMVHTIKKIFSLWFILKIIYFILFYYPAGILCTGSSLAVTATLSSLTIMLQGNEALEQICSFFIRAHVAYQNIKI